MWSEILFAMARPLQKGVDPDLKERLMDGFAIGTEAFREKIREACIESHVSDNRKSNFLSVGSRPCSDNGSKGGGNDVMR